MNNIVSDELPEILCSLDKMETVAKVLNQTMFEDKEFNAEDSQNLCAIILREINYTKSKISKYNR